MPKCNEAACMPVMPVADTSTYMYIDVPCTVILVDAVPPQLTLVAIHCIYITAVSPY